MRGAAADPVMQMVREGLCAGQLGDARNKRVQLAVGLQQRTKVNAVLAK